MFGKFQRGADGEAWDDKEIGSLLEKGILSKKHSVEHVALDPAFLMDPLSGILDSLENSLGKWRKRLDGYMVAYKNVKLAQNLAAIHYDNPWAHVDVKATFYIYKPQINQRLTGVIKKIGNKAALVNVICPTFMTRVFAQNEKELSSWSVGDELEFEIYSFEEGRRGAVLRGKTIASNRTSCTDEAEEISSSSTHKKKKKRKHSESEPKPAEVLLDQYQNSDNDQIELKIKSKKRKKSKSSTAELYSE